MTPGRKKTSPLRARTSSFGTAALGLIASMCISACSIEKLAQSIARTVIPLDDAGVEVPIVAPAPPESFLVGRPVFEAIYWDSSVRRCTLRGRLCLHAADDPGAEALLQVMDRVDVRLDGLPPSMQNALFSQGPADVVLSAVGGVRSAGFDRLTPGPRGVVALGPADGSEESVTARVLELQVFQRNPAASSSEALTLARALALRFGLAAVRTSSDAEFAILGPTHGDREAADGRFLAWLDERLSPHAGSLLTTSSAKSARGHDGTTWRTAGDVWFVLQKNFADSAKERDRFDELLLREAIEHSSTVDGRSTLAFRWDEPVPSRARRLLAARPVEPTGITWLRFDRGRDEHAVAKTLLIAADWEGHARFHFFAQLIDENGRLMRTHRFAVPPRDTHVEATFESLDGVASIVVGAINLGDPQAPFDPREGPWEPHSFMLTIAPMNADGTFL